MRPGAIKVESKGSYWWLDEAAGEYLRLPKEEKPRGDPTWGSQDAGALQDAVWLPMTGWRLGKNPTRERMENELVAAYGRDALDLFLDTPDGLIIDVPGDNGPWVWAPEAEVVTLWIG